MGFFNFLETAFFISLAITFVLIMMLVYHFKGRLVILEQKCDTMFQIMNNIIKEIKFIQARSIADTHAAKTAPTPTPAPSTMHQFSGGFPMDLLSMLGGNGLSQNQFLNEDYEDDEGDEYDTDEEGEDAQHKKIVVSDGEVDYDDEEDEKVKVIQVDISEHDVTSDDLPDLEEIEPEESLDDEAEAEGNDSLDKPVDYKKMDISYLRTLVITRGLASDTKKLKKGDLVKLLSDE